MRFVQTAALLSALCALAGFAATTSTRTTGVKTVKSTTKVPATKAGTKSVTTKTTSKAAPAKTGVSKSTNSAASKSKLAKGKKAPAPPVATWRSRQQNPTPDRYKEIQQALVDKGYLKSEPSGVWDADSVDALTRFQTDQKLTPTGKINAPSLIGLGLGAKSAGAQEAPPLPGAVTPPTPPEQPAIAASPPSATQ